MEAPHSLCLRIDAVFHSHMTFLQYVCSAILTESRRMPQQLLRATAATDASYPEEQVESQRQSLGPIEQQ
jgi:hypothetical protein